MLSAGSLVNSYAVGFLALFGGGTVFIGTAEGDARTAERLIGLSNTAGAFAFGVFERYVEVSLTGFAGP
jgi:hypothetical protein